MRNKLSTQKISQFLVQIGDLLSREALQLLNRSDADNLLHVVRDPEGDRGAPVSIARDGPVTGVAKPVGETLLLDEVGDPHCLGVIGEKTLDGLFNADEPGGHGFVEEGSVGTANNMMMEELRHSAGIG